jgi:hypothetical protein
MLRMSLLPIRIVIEPLEVLRPREEGEEVVVVEVAVEEVLVVLRVFLLFCNVSNIPSCLHTFVQSPDRYRSVKRHLVKTRSQMDSLHNLQKLRHNPTPQLWMSLLMLQSSLQVDGLGLSLVKITGSRLLRNSNNNHNSPSNRLQNQLDQRQ